MTRRQFLCLAGIATVNLLPLLRLQAKTVQPTIRKPVGGLPMPFAIPIPIGRSVDDIYIPIVMETKDDH